MRPSQNAKGKNSAALVAHLADFHDYCAAYPSFAQRIPALSAWVKARTSPLNGRIDSAPSSLPDALGLTAAETRLAEFLVNGGTLAQFAQRNTLSRHTARNHLQAIFAKVGVNRQADLVRLLMGA